MDWEGANVAKGYPEGALERLQEVEWGILQEVARVCEQLGIEWFADSGTAIGALRHRGFIPWDDDIDISMRLSDYRVFCEKAPALLGDEYGIYLPAATQNYPPLWAKVYRKGTRFMSAQMLEARFEQGIFVDVFAYMRLDSREGIAKRQMRDMMLWQRLSYLYHTAHPKIPAGVPCQSLVKLACVAAHKITRLLFTPQRIERRFNTVLESGDGKGKWVDVFYPSWGQFDDETLFPVRAVPFGEGSVFVPRDAHAYLTAMYGDYMQLPPEEERGAYPPVVLDFGDGVNVME